MKAGLLLFSCSSIKPADVPHPVTSACQQCAPSTALSSTTPHPASLAAPCSDIKPENILFTKDMRLKLCDFGLAINMREERAVTRVGTLECEC